MEKIKPLIIVSVLMFNVVSCSTDSTPIYQLETMVAPENTGTVSPSQGEFESGETVELTATSNPHWVFDRWQIDHVGTNNPIFIEMDSDKQIRASFVRRDYPVFLNVEGEGTISEKVITTKSTEYTYGTNLQLTANAREGWEFVEWSGSVSGNSNPTDLIVDSEKDITARFSTYFRAFGEKGDVYPQDISATSDGGAIVLAGFANSFYEPFVGRNDIAVIKKNSEGLIDWIHTLGGSSIDIGYNVIQTNDLGYAIVGYTPSNDGSFTGVNKGNANIFVAKLSQDGELEWIKGYGGSLHDQGRAITQTSDDDFVIAGYFTSEDGDFAGEEIDRQDAFLMKITSTGNIRWVNSIGGGKYIGNGRGDYGTHLIQTEDNGFVMAGFTDSETGDFEGIDREPWYTFVAKFNSDGELEWINSVGGSGRDQPAGIVEVDDGGIVVIGYSDSSDRDFQGINNGGLDIYYSKFNSSGELVSVKTFGGSQGEFATTVEKMVDGSILISGRFSSSDGIFSNLHIGNTDAFLINIDQYGNVNWVKSYGGGGNEYVMGISSFGESSIAVLGFTQSNDGHFSYTDNELNYAILFKTNLDGVFELF